MAVQGGPTDLGSELDSRLPLVAAHSAIAYYEGMPQAIDFYFDFASPYGYLASVQIDAWAKAHGRDVTWRPILLGAAFKEVGTAPLMSYPIKGRYAERDIARTARQLGVPCLMPEGFPHGTLAAARGFYWLADRDPATARGFAAAFYHAYFGEGRDVSPAETTADVAATVGVDRSEFLGAVQAPAIKEQVKAEVAAALQRGVFGSPFFFIDDEPFWGSDRLPQMSAWLEQGGW